MSSATSLRFNICCLISLNCSANSLRDSASSSVFDLNPESFSNSLLVSTSTSESDLDLESPSLSQLALLLLIFFDLCR